MDEDRGHDTAGAAATQPAWLTVIGIGDGGLSTLTPEQQEALGLADVIFGGARHLAMIGRRDVETVAWSSPLEASMTGLQRCRGRTVVVLATGDPSWYGIARLLRRHFAREEMRVLPAPPAFSLAAARLGWALEETCCRTVHGRRLQSLRPWLAPGARILVYSEDGNSPARIAGLLRAAGFSKSRLSVLEHLGGPRERVREASASCFDLTGIAALNTVAIECEADEGRVHPPRVPGLPDEAFVHDGKMTKRPHRALALALLAPRPGELLWDIGAGCGSVSVEWLRAASGARCIAVEPLAERRAMTETNAERLLTYGLRLIAGRAPEALAGLEPPDAVFIGGGLSEAVFQASFDALQPGGRLVAHAVTLESASLLEALHRRHGGELMRLSSERAEPVGRLRGWKPAMAVVHWHVAKPADG